MEGSDRAREGEAPRLVPARMVNEALYCERLLHIEWAQGDFADNVYTVDGRVAHRRADRPGGALPPAAAEGAATVDDERPYRARSVLLSSERLGIVARIDVVEGDESGTVIPIEYKRGEPPDVPEGAWLPERAQVCAQALLLREHGYRVPHAALYFAAARRRVIVALDDALIETTLRAVARARQVCESTTAPPPLVDSPKCVGCSLVGICLPDEINLLRSDGARGEAPSASEIEAPRRLHPARDDELPLYVQEAGARIGLDGECFAVRSRDGRTTTVRMAHTSQVSVYGNAQLTTQAMRAAVERGIPVAYLSSGGWMYARVVGPEAKNVELRIAQVRAALDPARCVSLARGVVASKIRNCRTLLRRNHAAPDEALLDELERSAKKAERADRIDALLGIEGTAARLYFGAFSGMLKPGRVDPSAFDLNGRNRRPPRDPINALLSFTYSLLVKEVSLAVAAAGLDPMIGFYHQRRFGRPSLALDLMEEFRPIVADSVVIGALNNGMFDAGDFDVSPVGVAMTPAARRRIIEAFERRMDQLVAHPVFDYRLSYRRVLAVQARLVGRVFAGEIDALPEFRTR